MQQINTIYMISIILLCFAIFFFLLSAFIFIKLFIIDHFSFSFLSLGKNKKKNNFYEEKKEEKKETKMWDETVVLNDDEEYEDTVILDESFDEEETILLEGKKKAKGFEIDKDIVITHGRENDL